MSRLAGGATRSGLLRSVRRLARVRKGSELLSRKRRALADELFSLARPAVDARERVAEMALRAYPSLLRALTGSGPGELRALGWPFREPEVEMRTSHAWGVGVAEILHRPVLRRSLPARGVPPAGVGPSVPEAAERFEGFLEVLLDAATRESHLRRLGRALSRTSRQANTLDREVAPTLETGIRRQRGILEEREREERARQRLLLRRRTLTRSRGYPTLEGAFGLERSASPPSQRA